MDWFPNKRRLREIEADLAALRAERAQADLALELERERAKAMALIGDLSTRLLQLHEHIAAQDRRSDALERWVEGLGKQIDELIGSTAARDGRDASSIEAQAVELSALKASLAGMERASRLARADVDQTLALLAKHLLPQHSDSAHVASGVPLS